jgi:hypothetical protein
MGSIKFAVGSVSVLTACLLDIRRGCNCEGTGQLREILNIRGGLIDEV